MNANAGPSEPQTGIRVPPGWRSHERPSIEEKSSSKGPQPLALPPTTTWGKINVCTVNVKKADKVETKFI